MTPAARLQAAIELLDQIIAATRERGAAADTLIAAYFKARRYAGSKDRRAIRNLVYRAIRHYWMPPESGRKAMIGLAETDPDLRALFDGSRYGPTSIGADEYGAPDDAMPDWLRSQFSPELEESDIESLEGRAPLDLRVNLSRISREAALEAIDEAEMCEASAGALRLPTGYPIETHPLFLDGLVEIQDVGSQLVVDACAVGPGMTVVDLCAGAGGKTLALRDRMGGKGRLIACDTDRRRLSQLMPRAGRAEMPGVETRLLDPMKETEGLSDVMASANLVLVDAPCSGTGTWRRNPEGRWRLNEEFVDRQAALQSRLLQIGADLVAPGGRLVYAVCSLLAAEGKDRIAEFLDSRSDFRKLDYDMRSAIPSGGGYLLTPARSDTDGFYFARMERLC